MIGFRLITTITYQQITQLKLVLSEVTSLCLKPRVKEEHWGQQTNIKTSLWNLCSINGWKGTPVCSEHWIHGLTPHVLSLFSQAVRTVCISTTGWVPSASTPFLLLLLIWFPQLQPLSEDLAQKQEDKLMGCVWIESTNPGSGDTHSVNCGTEAATQCF